jgi:RNA polymerase sigma factor (sigma-70 family)
MEPVLMPSKRPFKHLIDSELIESISDAERQELPVHSLLQNEFYYRFSSYVYKACLRFTSSLQGSHTSSTKDLHQEIFIKIFRKLNKFTINKEYSAERLTYSIKAWIGVIANRECLNYITKNITNTKVDYCEELPISAFDICDEEEQRIESPNELKLRDALSALPERNIHILRTYANFDCIETGNHLPDEAMAELCKVYDTTSENIRQIKKRSLDRLKQLVIS